MIKFKRELNKIKQYVPGKPIDELKRELHINRVIKLASNENPLGTSPKAVKVLERAYKDVYLYPDDSNYHLKKKIAIVKECSPENIIMGNGSVELLSNIINASCSNGDAIIRSEPSFIMSLISANIVGAKVINIKLKNYKHDIDSIIKKAKQNKPNIIYIDNPTNPIGTLLHEDEIVYILNNISKDTILILDEAYNEYNNKDNRVNSTLLMKKYKNLISLGTFSKIYGLAGLRVGYMIADKTIIDKVGKLRLPFNINLLGQKAALAAIDDKDFIEKSKSNNDKEKKFLNNEIKKLNFNPIESYTNFITFDTGKEGKVLFDHMLKKGIIIRPLNAYKLPSYIRVSIGRHSENKQFIDVFKEVINEI